MRITTIKLEKKTKERLERLKIHPKESYNEAIKKALEILNICRQNPLKGREKLMEIDRLHARISLFTADKKLQ